MGFGRETALRAGLGLMAGGFALTAIAFAAVGLYAWLASHWGVPGAAFATAGVSALMTGGLAMIALRRRPAPLVLTAQPAPSGQNEHLISALRDLTQDHPLLSVCAAAILGAVGTADTRRQ